MGLHMDVADDHDEGGYSTIRMTIRIHESVERIVELDNALRQVLYERLPARALFFFSVMYQFE
jgi:hypothetical protein